MPTTRRRTATPGSGCRLVRSVTSRANGRIAIEHPAARRRTDHGGGAGMSVAAHRPRTRASPASRRWKVMIVEDSPEVAALHRRLVDDTAGFRTIHIASDGVAALRALKALSPDLAIVDLTMPGGDGLTMLREGAARVHPRRGDHRYGVARHADGSRCDAPRHRRLPRQALRPGAPPPVAHGVRVACACVPALATRTGRGRPRRSRRARRGSSGCRRASSARPSTR